MAGTEVKNLAKSLTEIDSFGGTAAEDDDIARFFVRTPAFDELWNGEKCVVVGRKGAGKTALYLALGDEALNDKRLAASLSFRQYPWAAHYRYASEDVVRAERFVESWTFLFLVEAFDLLSGQSMLSATRGTQWAVGEVKKFIAANYGNVRLDFRKAFPKGGLALDTIEAGAGTKSANGKATFRKGEQVPYGATLGRVNEWLLERAKKLAPEDVPITYILMDELDLGFNPDDPDYIDRITGLLIATRRFDADMRRIGIQIRPVVFLRSDIFDRLHFGDKNKIRNANVVELGWHDDLNHSGSSLKHLIDWRIKEALGLASVGDAWSKAFDDQLTRGTQHKFQHITFRTLLRPRDVIKFANLALQQAKTNGLAHRQDGRINNADIKDARSAYSEYFRLELDDEVAESYPQWELYLEVLKSVGSAKFDRDAFGSAHSIVAKNTNLSASVDEVMAVLYEYSIIGFEKTRASGSGFSHHFRYQNESIRFDKDASTFLVHRGLKETLDITETS